MKIVLFDSGIGGISVLSEVMRMLPGEDFIYFADTLHVPYGTKSSEQVLRFMKESMATIMEEDVKAVVIACNTATSIAAEELRKMYPIPIIGMEPAMKPALEMTQTTGKRILVLATPLTLNQPKYKELLYEIDNQGLVDSLPLPKLVEHCEKLQFGDKIMTDYFVEQLSPFDLSDYETIVLGCTHFPFYKNLLTEILPPSIQLVHGNTGTVNRLIHVLREQNQLEQKDYSTVTFLCSSNDDSYICKMKEALEIFSAMN